MATAPGKRFSGPLRWTDYRSKEWPNAIKILHHKTGAIVWHPLEETTGGITAQFYPEAEAVLEKLPRRGVPMILRETKSANGEIPNIGTGRKGITHGCVRAVDRCRN
jgi:hypothetical protein